MTHTDQSKRADFLDGCGSLTLAEVREWARELTPHPAVCHDQGTPGDTLLVVAGMFAASSWRWAELLLERDDVAGREVLERMVAYYAEHDGRADDFGRLRIVIDAENALASDEEQT